MSTQRQAGMVLGLAALALLLGGTGRAKAGAIINIYEVGPDVVTTGSGSIDLTGLTFVNPASGVVAMVPAFAEITVGNPANTFDDIYSGVTGPPSFGSGGAAFASSGTGDFFGVESNTNEIGVPAGYVSGTLLSGTDTFANQTFSSLGLTPGIYTYTWGTGGPDHTLTVDIGAAPATVPEPSSLALFALGGLGLAGWRRWRKRSITA